MTRKASLPHVNEFKDRHGNVRRYVRRGGRSVPLKLSPDDAGYLAEYQEALKKAEPAGRKPEDGTWDAMCDEYLVSSRFTKRMGERNRAETRREILKIRKRWGDKPVNALLTRHVELWQDELSEKPGAANNMLACVRKLLSFGSRRGYCTTNVAAGVEKLPIGEYPSWDDEELAQYEAKWAIGTRERLAYALALYTGQRKGDLLRMTWAHFEGPMVKVAQHKTGKKLKIPVHPKLREVLDRGGATSKGLLLPIKSRHFGTIMANAISKAKLPAHCVLHGLRKAATRRLAEVGCTAHEIMAITGHATLAMVQKYAKDANQERLAKSAMKKLEDDGNAK